MKCADPVLCYTKDSSQRIFRNFSFVKDLTLFLQGAQQVFDCGKCLFCRKKKALELASRCVLHASLYKENCFLTLTYDEKKEGYHNDFEYSDIQKFKKRLRSHVRRTSGRTVEIFNVHEYGKLGKKHWHLIVFNWEPEDKKTFTVSSGIPLYTSERLRSLWPFGFSTVGDVSEGSAMYQSQYMEKDFKHRYAATAKRSHSKHSGIGKPYFGIHYKQILRLGYVPVGGRKIPVPRYFERIAHKHWSHFYEQKNFFDWPDRKRLYAPFKENQANKEIADLFIEYRERKQERVKELEEEWNKVVATYLTTNETPDFIKSAQNKLHDLRNKLTDERF